MFFLKKMLSFFRDFFLCFFLFLDTGADAYEKAPDNFQEKKERDEDRKKT
jgi:hypothetical protein